MRRVQLFNNLIDVRKFFVMIDGNEIVGEFQLLVKSMHKKVLKGTVVDA